MTVAETDPWAIIHRLVDREQRDAAGRCRWCLHERSMPSNVRDHEEGCVFYQARVAYNGHLARPRDVTGTLFEGVHERINEIVAVDLMPLRSMLEELTGRPNRVPAWLLHDEALKQGKFGHRFLNPIDPCNCGHLKEAPWPGVPIDYLWAIDPGSEAGCTGLQGTR